MYGVRKGSFTGMFYSRSLSIEESRGYHSSFYDGWELNDIDDTGKFRILRLGNIYWIDLRIYCDKSIMNLGEFSMNGFIGDGRDLEFKDYGDESSYYSIYAGDPQDMPVEYIGLSATLEDTGSTVPGSYEYNSSYYTIGKSIKVDRVDTSIANNVTVDYTINYRGTNQVLSIRIDFASDSLGRYYYGDELRFEDTLPTKLKYSGSITQSGIAPSTYKLKAIISFSNNTSTDMDSGEFVVAY